MKSKDRLGQRDPRQVRLANSRIGQVSRVQDRLGQRNPGQVRLVGARLGQVSEIQARLGQRNPGQVRLAGSKLGQQEPGQGLGQRIPDQVRFANKCKGITQKMHDHKSCLTLLAPELFAEVRGGGHYQHGRQHAHVPWGSTRPAGSYSHSTMVPFPGRFRPMNMLTTVLKPVTWGIRS